MCDRGAELKIDFRLDRGAAEELLGSTTVGS